MISAWPTGTKMLIQSALATDLDRPNGTSTCRPSFGSRRSRCHGGGRAVSRTWATFGMALGVTASRLLRRRWRVGRGRCLTLILGSSRIWCPSSRSGGAWERPRRRDVGGGCRNQSAHRHMPVGHSQVRSATPHEAPQSVDGPQRRPITFGHEGWVGPRPGLTDSHDVGSVIERWRCSRQHPEASQVRSGMLGRVHPRRDVERPLAYVHSGCVGSASRGD